MRRNSKIVATFIALLMTATSPAHADDGLIGGIIGFGVGVAVGKALNNNNSNNNTRPRARQQRRQPTAAELEAARQREIQRESNRELQRRLNMLGFDAGPEDGAVGRRTRAAVQSFQASLGNQATGELTDQEERALRARTDAGAPIQALAPPSQAELTVLPQSPTTGRQLLEIEQLGLVPPPTEGAASIQLQDVSATYENGGLDAAGHQALDVAVLGIRLGDERADTESLVAQAGYERCEPTGMSVSCEGSNGGMTDTLVVGFVRSGTDEVVHTISRAMTFETPVARNGIYDQLAVTYPDIVATPSMALASGDDCYAHASSLRSNGFRDLVEWLRSGEEANARVSALAAKCDYHYSIDLPSGDEVDEMSITFFSGRPILHSLTEGSAGSQAEPQIRF